MTDDIFDYFSGSSSRKVEPIEDDFDDEPVQPDEEAQIDTSASLENEDQQAETAQMTDSNDLEPSVSGEQTHESVSKASHWDRLLGKLGISSTPKSIPKPKSVELKSLSKAEKAAKAEKRRAQQKSSPQKNEPFGGIAAPPSSRQSAKTGSEQPGDTWAEEEPQTPAVDKTIEPSTRKKQTPTTTSKFGFGILDEIVDDDPDDATTKEPDTLAELFTHSDEFHEPFDPPKPKIVDDVPVIDPRDSSEFSELEEDGVDDEAEFIEYEVQDLDFDDNVEPDDRPRRPARRHRARRERETEVESSPARSPKESTRGRGRGRADRDSQGESGRSRRDKRREEPEVERPRSTRERSGRSRTSENEVVARDDADSTKTRRRRGSRGRGRGRSDQDLKSSKDEKDQWDVDEILDDAELEDSLDDVELGDDDDSVESESRGRRPRRGRDSRPRRHRTREATGEDRDEFATDAPKPARGRRRSGSTESVSHDDSFDSDDATDDRSAVKRPKIPTWEEAVNAMIDGNMKARGSKGSGSGGRGRGRRPRRR